MENTRPVGRIWTTGVCNVAHTSAAASHHLLFTSSAFQSHGLLGNRLKHFLLSPQVSPVALAVCVAGCMHDRSCITYKRWRYLTAPAAVFSIQQAASQEQAFEDLVHPIVAMKCFKSHLTTYLLHLTCECDCF